MAHAWQRRDGKGLLSAGQQARYERAGLTEKQYRSGTNLQSARGHGSTPEHPGSTNPATRRAEQFAGKSKAKRIGKGRPKDESSKFWEEYNTIMGYGK